MNIQQGYWKAMTPLIQQIKMVIKVNGLYPLSKTHERLLELEKVVKVLQNNDVIGVQKVDKSSDEFNQDFDDLMQLFNGQKQEHVSSDHGESSMEKLSIKVKTLDNTVFILQQ